MTAGEGRPCGRQGKVKGELAVGKWSCLLWMEV